MLPGTLDQVQPSLPRWIFNIFIEYGGCYLVAHGSEEKRARGRKEEAEKIKGCRGRKKGLALTCQLAENSQWGL